ncbi:MAG TPA: cobyrinate a,c-diamide synthase [Nitrososphaera sp.]
MNIPRVVVAGVTSGVGKTTVAMAIMHGLGKKGLRVQPFKVGPDFIDPSYHSSVAGRASRNLDVWMMGESGVIDCFDRTCAGAEIAVIEGVMGLFDGVSGKSNLGSTAHVARILKAPILLVVDGAKGARSIAAIILGFLRFDKNIKVKGIILNNISGDRHASYIIDAVSGMTRVPIVGVVKRDREIKMEERHLGLIPARELHEKRRKAIARAAKNVSAQLDIEKILTLCGTRRKSHAPTRKNPVKPSVRIGVALDDSFNFYYADNFDALRSAGAELVFYSPIHDRRLPPDLDGLILGGGFPEVLADRLEKNRTMINSVRRHIEEGLPVYGECGGLMYLTRSISGYNGEARARKMVGLVDADTIMSGRLTLNYTQAQCDAPLFGRTVLRGHEFHYSKITDIAPDSRFGYSMSKGNGVIDSKDGFIVGENGIAAYSHLHFAGNGLADGIVKACFRYSRR